MEVSLANHGIESMSELLLQQAVYVAGPSNVFLTTLSIPRLFLVDLATRNVPPKFQYVSWIFVELFFEKVTFRPLFLPKVCLWKHESC